MKSFSAASSTSASWPRNGWNSTWSAKIGATPSASRSIPAGKFETPRCLISPSSRSSASAPSVSSSGTSSFGQCRSRRSRQLDLQVLERLLGRRPQLVGAYSSRHSFVVRKSSLRGDAGGGDRLADLGLVVVGLRGVDVPVADLERVVDRLLAVAAEDLPGPEAELGDGRALDLEGAHGGVDRGHLGPVPSPARLLAFRADPRAISSAGRAPPRQGGGHWFEPSIAHVSAVS